MKHKHTSLKAKALKNPNRVFKDLKQKQKGKISDWLYIETYRYYWNCQEMCSQRIPKICNRQVSGGMVSRPG